ncbi:MAG: RsmB/NOP family class I SAM-dependent RNA methyltransferase [Candidatus ainarchaeum sp.]|nr:RsmB/NOP family class I SAM-dependent RNA methyltransferase [Candidatus ainarchaeum sp.]
MKKTFYPKEFIEKYKKLLGEEWDEFFKTISKKEEKSIWINNKKTDIEKIKQKMLEKNIVLKKYSFSEWAFGINYKKPGDLEEYKKGEISIQEKASMLPVIILNVKKENIVLDACASPGMKTIQLSNIAKKVIALDVNTKRTKILLHNKNFFGLDNVFVKRMDVRNFKEKFDKILLDAPCSSEGLVRKKRDALKGWTQEIVLKKSKIQKELLLHCFDLLNKNGELVYSTCSFAPEENEEVILYLLEKRKNAVIVPIKLEGIKIRKNLLCENCIRLWPQDNDTQQFFIAKIKKVN